MIEIEIIKATGRSALVPMYDIDADVLECGGSSNCSWDIGLDIDGTIIFDCDSEGVLVNLDLLIPKKFWRSGAARFETKGTYFDLRFTRSAIERKSFSFPISTRYDAHCQCLELIIGQQRAPGRQSYGLSPQCNALLQKGGLVGFQFHVDLQARKTTGTA